MKVPAGFFEWGLGKQVGLLVLAIIGANVVLGLLYGTSVRAYVESDGFKIVTISLALPILLLVLEKTFDVKKGRDEKLEQANREADDRKRKEIEVRSEKRWECVEQSSDMWTELWSASTEVCYADPAKTTDADLDRISAKLTAFSNHAEKVVNAWHYRFDNLRDEDTALFLVPINILLHASGAAAIILKSASREEWPQVQEALGMIQDGVKRAVHHPMLTTLQKSIDFLDSDETDPKRQEASDRIKFEFGELAAWVKVFTDPEKSFNAALPGLQGDEAATFRRASGDYLAWLRSNPPDEWGNYPSSGELANAFYRIPTQPLIASLDLGYTREGLERLAHEFAFQLTLSDLMNQARWQPPTAAKPENTEAA